MFKIRNKDIMYEELKTNLKLMWPRYNGNPGGLLNIHGPEAVEALNKMESELIVARQRIHELEKDEKVAEQARDRDWRTVEVMWDEIDKLLEALSTADRHHEITNPYYDFKSWAEAIIARRDSWRRNR